MYIFAEFTGFSTPVTEIFERRLLYWCKNENTQKRALLVFDIYQLQANGTHSTYTNNEGESVHKFVMPTVTLEYTRLKDMCTLMRVTSNQDGNVLYECPQNWSNSAVWVAM